MAQNSKIKEKPLLRSIGYRRLLESVLINLVIPLDMVRNQPRQFHMELA